MAGGCASLRDVANVTMDLNDVEAIEFRALGGADNIVINDSHRHRPVTRRGGGRSRRRASGSSTGDGQVDTVTVNGSAGNETINVTTAVNGGVLVSGSSRQRRHLPCRSDRPVDGHRLAATTSSTPRRSPPARSRSPSTAAPATTPSSAARATMCCSAATATISSTAAAATTWPSSAPATTFSSWDPGRRQRHRRGSGRHRPARLQRRQHRREHRHLGQWRAGALHSATSPTSPWISTTSSAIQFQALGGADNIVINDVTGTDLSLGGVVVDLEGAIGSQHRATARWTR